MQQYLKLLRKVLNDGDFKADRTGTGTISSFGHNLRFNLDEGFPLVTTKKIHFKSVVYELLWMLKGDTNINYLHNNNVRIWDEWANDSGDLGPVYGHQWRKWKGSNGKVVDQIKEAINLIINNPSSRRIIVNSWDASLLPDTSKTFDENIKNDLQALPPCHMMFQFNCRPVHYDIDNEGVFRLNNGVRVNIEHAKKLQDVSNLQQNYLDCQIYIRSNDLFLGNPFNIAQYALLIHIMSQLTYCLPGELIVNIGDAHIYSNHIEQVKLQLTRKPHKLPTLQINPKLERLEDLCFDDIILSGYQYHPHIKADVAI